MEDIRISDSEWAVMKVLWQGGSEGMSLKEIDEDVYRENLKSLLEKKIRSADNDDPRTLTRKAVAYAAARGYEADLIFEVFKGIIQEHQA